MVRNPSFPLPQLLSADELFIDGVLLPLLLLPHHSDPPDPEEDKVNSENPNHEPESLAVLLPELMTGLSTSKRWRDIFKIGENRTAAKTSFAGGEDNKRILTDTLKLPTTLSSLIQSSVAVLAVFFVFLWRAEGGGRRAEGGGGFCLHGCVCHCFPSPQIPNAVVSVLTIGATWTVMSMSDSDSSFPNSASFVQMSHLGHDLNSDPSPISYWKISYTK
ncbi:uncharacterized protein LOC122074420 [Macadamia integrifolia]|uniref:uncharacterized protein LOC122074420 n=1 Tax=Macadamia integrifolia TaxID=60698 RepID=UPI001C4E6017|nr:uncharacterized protein LOC122074420 [Macadamia integrifolia]